MSVDFIKPDLDKKEYKLITLPNGIKALIVSDVLNLINLDDETDSVHSEPDAADSGPEEKQDNESADDDKNAEETEKLAACALCVAVGSFSDPPNIPGLAHFLEHMVFMGSTKYPKENALDDYLTKRSGSNNAMTDFEYTTFYLECREIHLATAMDMFGQFFADPLLIKGAMERERQAIDSEFDLALPSDGRRFEQLIGSLLPDGHPGGFFAWGNKVTLQERINADALHDATRAFYNRHYSAHRMTIAVIARLPMNILEKYVRDSFSDIPNNELPPIDFSAFRGVPAGPKFNSLLWVNPVQDMCEVSLTWFLPPVKQNYESNPCYYLSALIGHEGDGSLHVYLKDKVLGLKTFAGNDGGGFEDNSLFSIFSITVELTQKGIERVNEVIKIVFSYLAMLREKLPNKEFFEELRDIRLANFKYRDEMDAGRYAEFLCESMQIYKPKHYLAGEDLLYEYNPNLIKTFLDLLVVDTVNVSIHNKAKPESEYEEVEPWFQTKFTRQEIPQDWKDSWKNAAPLPEFGLPKANIFIARKFTLLPDEKGEHPKYPEKIVQEPMFELWYRLDRKFKRPTACYLMYLNSPIVLRNARNSTLLDLLAAFLELKLGKPLYPANEAGFNWNIKAGLSGLIIGIEGFDENINMVYGEILKMIEEIRKTCDPNNATDIEIFEALKKDQSRNYYNEVYSTKKFSSHMRLKILSEDVVWPVEKRNCLLDGLTLGDLYQFYKEYLYKIYTQFLIQGNVDKPTAIKVASLIKRLLPPNEVEVSKTHRVIKLSEGQTTTLLVGALSDDAINAVVTNYYQCEPQGNVFKNFCMAELIMMLMQEPLFFRLRTELQIGYDVSCQAKNTKGVIGFLITVQFQSQKFTAKAVNDEIQAFLIKFTDELHNMHDIALAKQALKAMKKIEDESLKVEVARNFKEITSFEYKFDRLAIQHDLVDSITHLELCSWYNANILNVTRRKLSIQVVPSYPSPPPIDGKLVITPAPNLDPNVYVQDFDQFISRREFFPAQNHILS